MITWNHNHIQFARLLSELRAIELTPDQYGELCASMDLGRDDIDELFDRAQLEWERAKAGMPVRKTTPHREFMAFVGEE